MPLYRCAVREGATNETQRAAIAKEIVRVHCNVTGAPPSFVHAFFNELPRDELPAGKAAFILGSIRSGRNGDQKEQIARELSGFVANVLGESTDAVGVVTADVPAKWNMEGGELLPEPGEEAEWLERHGQA